MPGVSRFKADIIPRLKDDLATVIRYYPISFGKAKNGMSDSGCFNQERQENTDTTEVFRRLKIYISGTYHNNDIVTLFILKHWCFPFMHFFLLCLFVTISVPNPLPEEFVDQLDATNSGIVNPETRNSVSQGSSYENDGLKVFTDIPELEVSSNPTDAPNSDNVNLCTRGLVDVDDQSQSSSRYEIAQNPPNSCPANAVVGIPVKPGSQVGRGHIPDLPRRDIKCPPPQRGVPSHLPLCCDKIPPQPKPKPKPQQRRDLLKRDSTERTNCVDCKFLIRRTCFFCNPPISIVSSATSLI